MGHALFLLHAYCNVTTKWLYVRIPYEVLTKSDNAFLAFPWNVYGVFASHTLDLSHSKLWREDWIGWCVEFCIPTTNILENASPLFSTIPAFQFPFSMAMKQLYCYFNKVPSKLCVYEMISSCSKALWYVVHMVMVEQANLINVVIRGS